VYLVRSGDDLAVSVLLSVEVGSTVVIMDSVLEGIWLGCLIGIWGRGVVRGRGVVGGGWPGGKGNRHGHEGGDEDDTKHI
jgi:hypothetical protein